MNTSRAEDIELATQCAAGNEAAWERFVLEYRPILYRAADAIDPSGGARELADALYADLYGMDDRTGERRSLFRYFHGHSSLATWLRAVLAQRYIDRVRASRRLEPLPEDADRGSSRAGALASRFRVDDPPPDPDAMLCGERVRAALGLAMAALEPRDRLRLGCYYVQSLTLAQTGRVLREHEATVSRQLARTRRALRQDVEQRLRREHGLTPEQTARCLELAAADAGPLDLAEMLDRTGSRKNPPQDRSTSGEE